MYPPTSTEDLSFLSERAALPGGPTRRPYQATLPGGRAALLGGPTRRPWRPYQAALPGGRAALPGGLKK